MGSSTNFKIEEANNVTNPTNLAAAGIELVVNKPARVAHWNFLLIQNRDNVAIRILLDGQTGQGKVFEIQGNGGIFKIDPEDGINFRTVTQINLDGATAEVAGTISFSFANKRPVDLSVPFDRGVAL